MSDTAAAEHDDFDLGDDGANAFFENLTEEPKAKPEADPEDPEGSPAEDPETGDEPTAEPDSTAPDPDDAEVELGTPEAPAKAKLRDLKSAYAAQADTAARAAEVATRTAKVQADEMRTGLVLNKVLEQAQAKWAPYAKLDFLALSRDPSIDQATFAALRAEASAALTDVKYLTEELDGHVKTQAAATQAASSVVAQATAAALSNPETGIKGWNQGLYQEMLGYADSIGAPKGHPQSMVAEWALRALHKAMLYDKGVAATATKLAKVVAKPTRTLAPGTAGSQASTGAESLKSAMSRLKSSGSTDDAGDAFYASFGRED